MRSIKTDENLVNFFHGKSMEFSRVFFLGITMQKA